MTRIASLAVASLAGCGGGVSGGSASRDSIRAVGSSISYPFARVAAEMVLMDPAGLK